MNLTPSPVVTVGSVEHTMDSAAMSVPRPASVQTPRAGLAGWLGVLLVGLLCLNTAGGWVRLSGSGVAIPDWPLIEIDDGRRTLLPPMSENDWLAVHQVWTVHQVELAGRIQSGNLPPRAIGRQPKGLDEFRSMFLIEWLHRLGAALVVLLALACLGTALADRGLRRRIGIPVAAAVGLIVLQAVIGAALINEGTSNHWLFLHQGNAALILMFVLIAILRLLGSGEQHPSERNPGTLTRVLGVAVVATWIELMFGGLLASSRHQPDGMVLSGVVAHILDNALLHQITHIIIATTITVLLVVALVIAHRHLVTERIRLALQVAGTFLAMQALLGVTTAVIPNAAVVVPLAHLFIGHVLLLVLVLAWHDAYHAPITQRLAT